MFHHNDIHSHEQLIVDVNAQFYQHDQHSLEPIVCCPCVHLPPLCLSTALTSFFFR